MCNVHMLAGGTAAGYRPHILIPTAGRAGVVALHCSCSVPQAKRSTQSISFYIYACIPWSKYEHNAAKHNMLLFHFMLSRMVLYIFMFVDTYMCRI